MKAAARFAPLFAAALWLSPSAAHAQDIPKVPVGARVRAYGERATNDGLRSFRVSGTLAAIDSVHLVLLPREESASADTVALFGVRRLEVFRGMRSRRTMIVSGAAIGATAGTVAWLVGRQMIGSTKTATTHDDLGGARQTRSVVEMLRVSIPIWAVGGGLIGALIGTEHWERVPVRASVFNPSQ